MKTLIPTVFSDIIRATKNPDGISLPRGWQPKGLATSLIVSLMYSKFNLLARMGTP